MKTTNLNRISIQALILTLYLRKDLFTGSIMIELIFSFFNARKDLPESLKKDLLWLIGKEICQLIKPKEVENKEGEDWSVSVIMQSDILSGGL